MSAPDLVPWKRTDAAECVRWVQFLTAYGARWRARRLVPTRRGRPRTVWEVLVFPAGRPEEPVATLQTWGDVRACIRAAIKEEQEL